MNSNQSSDTQPTSWPNIVEKDLSYTVVGAFFRVYNALGYARRTPDYRRDKIDGTAARFSEATTPQLSECDEL
jgi:hypothetical protein